MNTTLQNQIEKLELDRIKLLDTLRKAPEEKFDVKADAAHWSINQILIHLLTSEQLTLNYLKKKSLGIDQLGESGPIESLEMIVLKISQRIPLKYKAPKVLAENTPNSIPFQDLVEQWNSSRKELRNFLDSIEEKHLHKLIYKHPVAGRFDVVQCLTFLREHFHHHLPQIKRLL